MGCIPCPCSYWLSRRMIPLWSTFLFLMVASLIQPVWSLATTSPWAPATWTLTLDFHRSNNNGNKSPTEYGVSGNRVVIPITVEIQSDSSSSGGAAKEDDSFVGPGTSLLVPKTDGRYITFKGEQVFRLSVGEWSLQFPPGKQGFASTLRFWMDLETPLEKNDIVLPQGQRLYFLAKTWREEEYELGLKRIRPLFERANKAQERLDETLSHETGDRRLDGKDALETIQAYRDMTQLVLERDLSRQELLNALERFPPSDQDLPEGPWPGAEEWMTLSNQNNPILISKPKVLLGEEYLTVGTWTASPVLLDDEYELVVMDDDRERYR